MFSFMNAAQGLIKVTICYKGWRDSPGGRWKGSENDFRFIHPWPARV
ncbi:hypothetical protein [Bacteroides acidifaciens]